MTVTGDRLPKHPADAQFAALMAAHIRQADPQHPEVALVADAGVEVAGEYGLMAYIKALVAVAVSMTMTWAENDPENRAEIFRSGKAFFAFGHNKVDAHARTGKPDRTAVVGFAHRGGRA